MPGFCKACPLRVSKDVMICQVTQTTTKLAGKQWEGAGSNIECRSAGTEYFGRLC